MWQLLLPLLLSLVGCGTEPARPSSVRPVPHEPRAFRSESIPSLEATELVSVPAGSTGPRLCLGERSGILVWAEPEAKEVGGWRTLPLDAHCKPRGSPRRVADGPHELGLLAVRRAGPVGSLRGTAGFLVLGTEARAGRELVLGLLLTETGELAGGPTVLAEQASAEPVLWLDALPTRDGTLVLWAARKEQAAQIALVELDPQARPRSAPRVIVRSALAWQLASGSDRSPAALAVVSAGETAQHGTVGIWLLEAKAEPRIAPAILTASPTANPDVDLARIGDRWVVGWSDQREGQVRVYLASLGLAGTLASGPAPATDLADDQALVRIVPPLGDRAPGYLAWEDLGEQPEQGRKIRLAEMDREGRLARARAELSVASRDRLPELAGSAQGLVALTMVPPCTVGETCTQGTPVPTFVEFGPGLKLVASEPLRLDILEGNLVDVGWDLVCTDLGCRALAAGATAPTRVFAVELRGRSNRWKPAGGPVAPTAAPRAVSVETVAVLDPLSDVAAARTATGTVLAWLTYFDPLTPVVRPSRPAPDGRLAQVRALLQAQALVDSQSDRLPPETISYRAHSPGGIAMARALSEPDEVLLAWSALDNGHPEVFLTLLDGRARRLRQRVLTQHRAHPTDLAVAPIEGGWMVGWIGQKAGSSEVRLARVDRKLERRGPERSLVSSTQALTGLRLLARGGRVFAVWADARSPGRPGWADIWSAVLDQATGEPLVRDTLLASTPGHSHSPVLAEKEDGVWVAWIEEGSEGQGGQPGVRMVRLDEQGAPATSVESWRPTRGSATACELECGGPVCHLVMAVDRGTRSGLEVLVPGQTAEAKPLLLLGGPPAQSPPLALVGRELFYADTDEQRRGRVRRIVIEW